MPHIEDFKDPDFLYATTKIAIFSDLEQGLAIIAGSLATLRPLFRLIAARVGLSTGTPNDASKPTDRRTPQWKPPALNNSRKGFPSFGSLFRTEKGTVVDDDGEYGMGDLQPMRLRDDLADNGVREQSDKGFSAWSIRGGHSSDKECQAGTIIVQTQLHRESEGRGRAKE